MRARAAGVIAAIGFLGLVTNRHPLLPISCLALGALIGVGPLDSLGWRLLGVWAYWIGSFLMSCESIRLLFSTDFHRRDGQIFFSLLPLLLFSWIRPDSRKTRIVLGIFWLAQAMIAAVSLGFDFSGHRTALRGFTFYPDEGENTCNYCGLYLAHNAVGSVQALGVVVTATLAVFSTGSRARWFWGALSIPLLWGVILSQSRGSLIAMVIALGVLVGIAIRQRAVSGRAVMRIGAVLVVTLVLFGSALIHRLGQFANESGTHTGRWEWWKRAMTEWTWSPIVGEGMGRYNDHDREWSGLRYVYYVVTKATVVNDAWHAHNSYLHFLAEGGVVGLVLTAGLWVWAAWRLRSSRDPVRRAALLGILYLFAVSATEHYMGGGAMLLVLSCLVGAAWNLPEPGGLTARSDPGSASPPRIEAIANATSTVGPPRPAPPA
jgi:hypothetical protein